MSNAFLAFLNEGEVRGGGSSSSIYAQVLLPGDTSLIFANLRVWALSEASHTERNTDAVHCSPEELKGSVLGPLFLGL